jgi:hypothetical protein
MAEDPSTTSATCSDATGCRGKRKRRKVSAYKQAMAEVTRPGGDPVTLVRNEETAVATGAFSKIERI